MPVLVNLYELDPRFSFTAAIGLGVFHSALEIGGLEVAFGMHQGPGTGIFFAKPLTLRAPARFYQQLHLGNLEMQPEEFVAALRSLKDEWRGREYSIIGRNCNDFTDTLLDRIGALPLPPFVNRAAKIGGHLGVQSCISGGVGAK